MTTATIKFDGSARPNPGTGAIGYIVKIGEQTIEGSECIGNSTNNRAEYHALINALQVAQENGCTVVKAEGDSELIVKQIQGEYNVDSSNLQPLHKEVEGLIGVFEDFQIEYVPRCENRKADKLAKEALP